MMKPIREKYEKRLFRIFAQAGYTPTQLLTISPEKMVEVPGVTVPNIRTILFLQRRLAGESSAIRRALLIEEYLRMAEKEGVFRGS